MNHHKSYCGGGFYIFPEKSDLCMFYTDLRENKYQKRPCECSLFYQHILPILLLLIMIIILDFIEQY